MHLLGKSNLFMNGEKEVLGIWVGANESNKFWLGVLNDLRNHGVEKC